MASSLAGKLVSLKQFKPSLILFPVMGLYEYSITFVDEIRVVWKRPWTLASVLLLSVRWKMVVFSLLELIPVVAQFSISIFREEC